MAYEIDHVLLFVRRGAPERSALEAAGLVEGRRTRHAGQGTANVCYFFADAMLELIWVEDENEARSPAVQPLGIWERSRWHELDTNPVGIALRRSDGAPGPWPFATWSYRALRLPQGEGLAMACNSGVVHEPLLFGMPCRHAPPTTPADHPLAQHRVRKVVVAVRDLAPGSPLRELALPGLEFRDAPAHGLRIELDGGSGDRTVGGGPDLPVELTW